MSEATADPLIIPEPGDPDRKRALNVLAQRRYRQRRREKIKALERRVRSTSSVSPVTTSSSSSDTTNNPFSTSDSASELSPETLLGLTCSETLEAAEPILAHSLPSDQSFDLDLLWYSGALPNSTVHNEPSAFGSPGMSLSVDSNSIGLTEPQSSIPISSELQTLEACQFTFPDDSLLPVPEFALMTASINIATLLGVVSSMWDLTTLRTFTTTDIPSPHIPSNLSPTSAQQLIPHHPIFDLFPWPSVRTRIICVFAQPAHTRPFSAREPDALMKLFYDMDDSSEGVRVTGAEWYDEKNWEIGQTIFKNWWWAFDRDVIENSNRLRRRRGAARLTMGGQ